MQQSIAIVELRADNAAGDLLSDVVAEDRSDVTKSPRMVVAGAHDECDVLIETHSVVDCDAE